VIATAVFVAFHAASPRGYRIADLATVAISGVLYGVLFERTRALWPAIVAHAGWNGAWLLSVAGGVPVVWSLGAPAAGAVAIVAGTRAVRLAWAVR
jgi:membrane protease YdiL (CAAX protease family)